MRFEQREDGWALVDGDSRLLATLRSEVEVLALREFCTRFVERPGSVPEHFTIAFRGLRYTVTPLGGQGEHLTLLITAPDGVRSRIDTGLVLRW